MDQMFYDPHRAHVLSGQMAVPVGEILHSDSKWIHPAYGHASQGRGLAPRPQESTLTGWRTRARDLWRGVQMCCPPRHRKLLGPKALTRHIFTHVKKNIFLQPWKTRPTKQYYFLFYFMGTRMYVGSLSLLDKEGDTAYSVFEGFFCSQPLSALPLSLWTHPNWTDQRPCEWISQSIQYYCSLGATTAKLTLSTFN